MFERIQTSLKAIKRQLLSDEVIRKLLYNDSNNALNLPTPQQKDVEKYITNHPIYEFENKQEYNQHGMINVFMTDSEPDEDNIISTIIRINVVYNVDKWELIDGSCRPLAIADRIIELIDNKKLSISNPISYASIQELILSKQLVGYTLLFDFIDGDSDLENF